MKAEGQRCSWWGPQEAFLTPGLSVKGVHHYSTNKPLLFSPWIYLSNMFFYLSLKQCFLDGKIILFITVLSFRVL